MPEIDHEQVKEALLLPLRDRELREKLKKYIEVYETDNHLCIGIPAKVSRPRTLLTIRAFSNKYAWLTLFFPKMFKATKVRHIKDILCIDKTYRAPSGVCSLYAGRNRLSMSCRATPEIAEYLIEKYKPSLLLTVVDPSLYPFCNGKQVIEYYINDRVKSYICMLE